MANTKKLLQAAAGTAAAAGGGGAGGTDVTDVFSTYLYEGNAGNHTITNGLALGDAYSLLFFGADCGNSSNYSTTSTGWETLIDLGNQGTPDVNFFVATKAVTASGTDSITVSTSNSNADPGYISFNAVDFSYRKSSHGSGTVELNNLAANSVVFLLEACDAAQVTSYTPPSGFTLVYLNNFANLGTSASLAVSYQQFDGGSVSTSGGTFSSGSVYRALVEVSAPVGTSVTTEKSGGFNSNVASFTETTHSLSAPTGVGDGGLVWVKNRTYAYDHYLYDTERGATKYLSTNDSDAEATNSNSLTSFNSNGFTLGLEGDLNGGGHDVASFSFKKRSKFFDIVQYTGTGSAQSISHSLGSVPGMIIVKKTSGLQHWAAFHRSLGEGKIIYPNRTNAAADNTGVWNNTAPTSTSFSVSTSNNSNESGQTYIAYLFAHNDGDGDFGPNSDQDIIKCGSYTGNGSATGPEINLGWEPQWILIKRTSGAEEWLLFDTMRGIPTGGYDPDLRPAQSNAENTDRNWLDLTSTGFQPKQTSNHINGNGETYIYIAIRRGPLASPTDATEVFAVDQGDTTSTPAFNSGFVTDFNFYRNVSSSGDFFTSSRLTGTKYLATNSTAAESSSSSFTWDHMDGFREGTLGTTFYSWMWKRAPGFFDVVAYAGNGTAGRTVSHNLGVAPEMMWIKRRSLSRRWCVYSSTLGGTDFLVLDDNAGTSTATNKFNDTDPTASVFTLGSGADTNTNGETYIAYLFASLDGVSKVGSYTGTGTSSLTVDCGFSSGARFVMIKRTDAAGNWTIFDAERGIVAGADPFLYLNATNAEATSGDRIDPNSTGFEFNNDGSWGDVNASGGTYIFYAIA